MKPFVTLFLLIILYGPTVLAQTSVDSAHVPIQKKDSILKKQVSIPDTNKLKRKRIVSDSLKKKVDSISKTPLIIPIRGKLNYAAVLKLNPYFNFLADPIVREEEEHRVNGKEGLFYLFAALLIYFAIIKVVFARYLNNLLALVFRVSLKQKQIREQLMQTPLASLLLNCLFVVVAGLYVTFILEHNDIVENVNFWLLLMYCSAGIAVVYLVKFVTLKFSGWVFNMREASNTYLFIVFLVNKLLGLFLLPVLILMAFTDPSWWDSLSTISYIIIAGFFAYRYIVSFAPVRREAKVSQFHFFVYLCAFEIAPLLLIYKVLMELL